MPCTYYLNLLVEYTMARSSFSICAYDYSVGVRALEMYEIGCPSCINTAPSPNYEASHYIVLVALISKYLKTGGVEIMDFIS